MSVTRAFLPRSGSLYPAQATPRARALGNGVRLEEVEDRFVARLLENCLPQERGVFSELQSKSLRELSTIRMPTSREEAYKFTDISPIVQSDIKKPENYVTTQTDDISGVSLEEGWTNRVVMFNGRIQWDLTTLEPDLKMCLQDASHFTAPEAVGSQTSIRGGTFATLNDALFEDALGIFLPADTQISQPLHLLYVSSGGIDGRSVNAPRLFIKCDSGSKIEIVEEFMTLGSSSSHLSLPVCEVELGESAELVHHYTQLDGPASCHMKTTLIRQAARSKYSLVECSVGGLLSRHDLGIEQEGQATETDMHHFHLSGDTQLHDLHSRVKLDHSDGIVNQLHKCIVTSPSGSGVFDGNVKVNRMAQKTDAGQLSRNLLLAPKATVNVKPNLQIIADDVKCTHGCTVSDLSDDEVFYFRARGIDLQTARSALVSSFGLEIQQKLLSRPLQERVQNAVTDTLRTL